MIDRAIKSRCRATDRGTLGADRRPSAVGRRRSRRGLMQPCTTPRGAIRPQLLVMSRPEAFRGALLRPLLAYEIAASRRCLTTTQTRWQRKSTKTDFVGPKAARTPTRIDSEELPTISWNPPRVRERELHCYVNQGTSFARGALRSSFIVALQSKRDASVKLNSTLVDSNAV